MGVDPQIVDLIGAIYDAAVDADRWYEALDRVRLHFKLANVMMALHDLRSRSASLSVLVNISDEWAAAMAQPEYNSELFRLLGGRERIEGLPLEEPVNTLGVIDQTAMEANRYYTDLAQPHGIIDSIAIVLTRDRFRVGSIGLGRHRDAGPVTPDVIAGLRVLAPHLRRAALIAGILEEERQKRRVFEAIVNAVRTGIVLVDADANIVHANPAAMDLMANGDPLADRFGRLQINGEVVHGALNAAILAAAEGDIALGRRGIAIPGTRANGEPFIVHLMPLAQPSARNHLNG
jgi:PAS domain-containing protein